MAGIIGVMGTMDTVDTVDTMAGTEPIGDSGFSGRRESADGVIVACTMRAATLSV